MSSLLEQIPTPNGSSRDLENLAVGIDFLNTRDPERYLSQNFPGSRILRKAIAHLRSQAFLNSGMTLHVWVRGTSGKGSRS